jgi:transposase
MKVLMEVLTRKFTGIIVCDGWKPYARFTKRLQRCRAHILRESKDFSEKNVKRFICINALKKLYEELDDALENDPPPEVRKELWHIARATLKQWIMKEYVSENVKKLIGKINNGFEYWFSLSFILV